MNNRIICSTGTILGRINNFDFDLFVSVFKDVEADGFEFMTEKEYEGKYDDFAEKILRHNIPFDVVHTLKDIGIFLAEDDISAAQRGIDLFSDNCRFAKKIGAKKVVIHLWSGLVSDSKIENNIRHIETLSKIAEENEVLLVIENVPCTTRTPKENFIKILGSKKDACFTFDTRFAMFHGQLKDEFYYELFRQGNIRHVHISEFAGEGNDFTKLRPILHPTEGKTDFDYFFSKVVPCYDGAFNLESPVFSKDGLDIEKLNKSLNFIRDMVAKYSK